MEAQRESMANAITQLEKKYEMPSIFVWFYLFSQYTLHSFLIQLTSREQAFVTEFELSCGVSNKLIHRSQAHKASITKKNVLDPYKVSTSIYREKNS